MKNKRNQTNLGATENIDEELIENLDALEATALDIEYAPEELEDEYQSSGLLHIPEEARKLYEERGWELQWARVYRPDNRGQIDLENVQRKEADKYQFVPRNEVPGLTKAMSGYFGKEVSEGSHGLYIVGDLALVKIPLARKAAKRKALREKTRSRSQAIINDLRKNAAMPSADRNEGWNIERSQPKGREVRVGDDE